MRTKSWDMTILVGILLGASLGGIVALILARRSKEGFRLGLRDVSWIDLIKLIGPSFALGRQLLELSRRATSELDVQ